MRVVLTMDETPQAPVQNGSNDYSSDGGRDNFEAERQALLNG